MTCRSLASLYVFCTAVQLFGSMHYGKLTTFLDIDKKMVNIFLLSIPIFSSPRVSKSCAKHDRPLIQFNNFNDIFKNPAFKTYSDQFKCKYTDDEIYQKHTSPDAQVA